MHLEGHVPEMFSGFVGSVSAVVGY